MSKIIPRAGLLAAAVLLAASGAVTTHLPEGAVPVWSVSAPEAFSLVPSVDGLSVTVIALDETGATATLTFTAGDLVFTRDIEQAKAVVDPVDTSQVAVSGSIVFADELPQGVAG